MKIGIMGGTFDPIHIGHLLLGMFAYEDFGLDEIWFLPNGNPPHKQTKEGEEALGHRIEMVRRAISDVPYFRLCLHEAKEKEHSYTYKTMRELCALYPEDTFYFILGADSLFAIEEWKYFREIFPTCTILAAMRDDKDVEDMMRQISYLEEHIWRKDLSSACAASGNLVHNIAGTCGTGKKCGIYGSPCRGGIYAGARALS